MKLKSLYTLIAVIVIGSVIYYLNSRPERGMIDTDSYLIPGLSAKLNDVTKLTVVGADNVLLTAVSRAENNWIVENRNGYEADIDAIRAVFNDLAEARLIEIKTSNPENYARLGVEDITDASARGVQFSIEGLDEPVSIIAGEKDSTRKDSQYVRRTGEQQSWLINRNLDLNRNMTRWLRKDILDIPPERIKSIKIKHADGSEIKIENRETSAYEFTLLTPLPKDKKVSESELYQVANALSSLQLRDVALLEKLDGKKADQVVTTFTTYDGLTITAKSHSVAEEIYFAFGIEFDAKNVAQDVENEPGQPLSALDAAAAEELARKTASRVAGWAFVLPIITRDALIKKLEDFILDENV